MSSYCVWLWFEFFVRLGFGLVCFDFLNLNKQKTGKEPSPRKTLKRMIYHAKLLVHYNDGEKTVTPSTMETLCPRCHFQFIIFILYFHAMHISCEMTLENEYEEKKDSNGNLSAIIAACIFHSLNKISMGTRLSLKIYVSSTVFFSAAIATAQWLNAKLAFGI